MSEMRVLLADDHQMLRQGIAQIIDEQPDMVVVAQANNGQEAVELTEQLKPDIVLLDINMPVLDGVAAARQIAQAHPATGIIILTMYRRDQYVFEAIKAGANGYILKEATLEELLAAIRAVSRGEAVIDSALAKLLLQELKSADAPEIQEPQLHQRDIQLLQHLSEGLSNQEIAGRMELAEKTVRNRLSSLCRQLQLKNRTQAVLYALEAGLVVLEDDKDN